MDIVSGLTQCHVGRCPHRTAEVILHSLSLWPPVNLHITTSRSFWHCHPHTKILSERWSQGRNGSSCTAAPGQVMGWLTSVRPSSPTHFLSQVGTRAAGPVHVVLALTCILTGVSQIQPKTRHRPWQHHIGHQIFASRQRSPERAHRLKNMSSKFSKDDVCGIHMRPPN